MKILSEPVVIAEGKRIKAGVNKGVALQLKAVEHSPNDHGPASITPYAHRPNCKGIVAAVVQRKATNGIQLLFLTNNRPALAENGSGEVVELVAGKVGDEQDEGFDTAAKREVMEEGGYQEKQVTSVIPYNTFGRNHASSSGLTSEGTDFFEVNISGKSSGAIDDAGTIEGRHWVDGDLKSIVAFLSNQANGGANISKQALTGLFLWVAKRAEEGNLKLKPDNEPS